MNLHLLIGKNRLNPVEEMGDGFYGKNQARRDKVRGVPEDLGSRTEGNSAERPKPRGSRVKKLKRTGKKNPRKKRWASIQKKHAMDPAELQTHPNNSRIRTQLNGCWTHGPG